MKTPQIYSRRPVLRKHCKIQKNNNGAQYRLSFRQQVKIAAAFFIIVGLAMLVFTATAPIDYIPIGTIVSGLFIGILFK